MINSHKRTLRSMARLISRTTQPKPHHTMFQGHSTPQKKQRNSRPNVHGKLLYSGEHPRTRDPKFPIARILQHCKTYTSRLALPLVARHFRQKNFGVWLFARYRMHDSAQDCTWKCNYLFLVPKGAVCDHFTASPTLHHIKTYKSYEQRYIW